MTHSEDRWPPGRKRAVRQIIRVNRLDHGPPAGGGLQNSGAIHRRMKGRATAGQDEMSRPGNGQTEVACPDLPNRLFNVHGLAADHVVHVERMSAPGIWEHGHTVESILGVLTSPNREDEPVWREKTEQRR